MSVSHIDKTPVLYYLLILIFGVWDGIFPVVMTASAFLMVTGQVRDCRDITSAAIAAIATSCPLLESLLMRR